MLLSVSFFLVSNILFQNNKRLIFEVQKIPKIEGRRPDLEETVSQESTVLRKTSVQYLDSELPTVKVKTRTPLIV